MDKGQRIKITSGDDTGKMGTVFWTGEDRYRGGLRLGVRGDDGETYWINESDVEKTDAPEPPPPPSETFERDDRVRFRNRGEEGTGTVFWTGESRRGGQRLGIRDDRDPDGEAIWLDARFAKALSPEEDQGAPPRSGYGGGGGGRGGSGGGGGGGYNRSGGGQDEDANAPEAMMGGFNDGDVPPAPPQRPEAPPMDDAYIDAMAAGMDEDGGDIPW